MLSRVAVFHARVDRKNSGTERKAWFFRQTEEPLIDTNKHEFRIELVSIRVNSWFNFWINYFVRRSLTYGC